MATVSGSIHIDAPPAQVFEHLMTDDGWRRPVVRKVEHLSGEGVGARYRNKVRVMGLPQTIVNEITAVEPPRLMTWTQVNKAPVVTREGRYELEPAGDGTRFTLVVEYEGKGPGKLMVPFTRWYVDNRLKDRFLGQLKTAVEGG